MRLFKYKSNELLCFSPPIMIATFIAEVAMAIYVVWRYKLTTVARLGVAMLLSLAAFQLAEYRVCESHEMIWANIGYIAITLLPPLGLHLGLMLAKRKSVLLSLAYLSCGIFILLFGLMPNAVLSGACNGNYAIFILPPQETWLYGFYYYGFLVATLVMTLRSKQKAARWLGIGYLCFMVPTAVLNVLKAETAYGIPSIMCGFAVIYALILVVKMMPLMAKRQKR